MAHLITYQQNLSNGEPLKAMELTKLEPVDWLISALSREANQGTNLVLLHALKVSPAQTKRLKELI